MQPTNTPQYFIIGGGGKVGYFLAKTLLAADHEVVLLDKDPRRYADLRNELGDSVERGDACEASTLERVGCARADYLLAVTGDDEDNLVMCQVAKAGFFQNQPQRRTIARVNNVANIPLFNRLGIDVIVSPTQNILDAIQTELPLHTVVQFTPPANNGPQLIELRVPADSPARNQPLAALKLPKETQIVLLIRGTTNLTPDYTKPLQAGDKLFAVVSQENIGQLRRAVLGVSS